MVPETGLRNFSTCVKHAGRLKKLILNESSVFLPGQIYCWRVLFQKIDKSVRSSHQNIYGGRGRDIHTISQAGQWNREWIGICELQFMSKLPNF